MLEMQTVNFPSPNWGALAIAYKTPEDLGLPSPMCYLLGHIVART